MADEKRESIFRSNVLSALKWLFETQDDDSYGWSWIQDVSPNAQNTAEVVSVCIKFADWLDQNQREFVNEAVRVWLLDPSVTGTIVIDYVWMMYSLTLYSGKYDLFSPDFSRETVNLAASKCMELLLLAQNTDGGWADSRGEASTSVRTALVLYCMYIFADTYGITDRSKTAMESAEKWLVKNQNSDGGWGNQSPKSVDREFQGEEKEFSYDAISGQYLSSPAVTGYAVMALNSACPHLYPHEIRRGLSYLKSRQHPDGGFDMFYEVGMRGDVRFTFRHFGTVWALKGLLTQKEFQEDDQTIVKGLGYLIQLQDVATGAWKCTPESDVYTWSTCNALSVIASVVEIQDGILEFQYRNILERMWNRYLTEEEPEKARTRKSRPGLLAVSAAVVAGCCAVKVLSDLFRGKE